LNKQPVAEILTQPSFWVDSKHRLIALTLADHPKGLRIEEIARLSARFRWVARQVSTLTEMGGTPACRSWYLRAERPTGVAIVMPRVEANRTHRLVHRAKAHAKTTSPNWNPVQPPTVKIALESRHQAAGKAPGFNSGWL